MSKTLSYREAGVDIDNADAAKREMGKSLATNDERLLNKHGAFAALFQGTFPGYRDPVLVLKTEEPGTKQKLAIQNGRVRSICFDMINHLINDIAVMGAEPLAVQDCIVCGKLESAVVTTLVSSIAEACRSQGCVLTGGETSEQPGVIPEGTYILSSSIVGVVERSQVIDGGSIRAGDAVFAIASNGLHTNGYSLVRRLLERDPSLAERDVDGRAFLDVILEPHLCYLKGLREISRRDSLHGLAHITGGGIGGNLNRIMPPGLSAVIELSSIQVLPVFKLIAKEANLEDRELLKTFNLGVGITGVCDTSALDEVIGSLEGAGYHAYPLGTIRPGKEPVVFEGALRLA